jgi:hypothetical protein
MVIATIGNLALRMAWSGYAEVEPAMRFDSAMMMTRLFLGALSSVGAGFVLAWITRHNARALFALIAASIIVFIPVHYDIWDKFPLWYHVVFFVSLVVMPLVGALLSGRNATRGSGRIDQPAGSGHDRAA